MGRAKRYIKRAILDVLKDRRSTGESEWVLSREIVDDVTKRIGRPISTQGVAHHLSSLRRGGWVESQVITPANRFSKWRLMPNGS